MVDVSFAASFSASISPFAFPALLSLKHHSSGNAIIHLDRTIFINLNIFVRERLNCSVLVAFDRTGIPTYACDFVERLADDLRWAMGFFESLHFHVVAVERPYECAK
jgi:hypothetical protein